MSRLAQLYLERREQWLVPVAAHLQKFLEECFEQQPRIDRVVARAKTVERFLAKAERTTSGTLKYTDPLNQIQDQIGARIVTFYSSDVPVVSDIAKSYMRHIEERSVFPDSQAEFGYFGTHYIMLLPKDVVPENNPNLLPFFELQIKTLFQHAWSEANHDLGYKPDGALSGEQKRKLAFTSAQAWGADLIFDNLFNETASASADVSDPSTPVINSLRLAKAPKRSW